MWGMVLCLLYRVDTLFLQPGSSQSAAHTVWPATWCYVEYYYLLTASTFSTHTFSTHTQPHLYCIFSFYHSLPHSHIHMTLYSHCTTVLLYIVTNYASPVDTHACTAVHPQAQQCHHADSRVDQQVLTH